MSEREEVTVSIDMGEVIYDVQNKTYLTGRARSDGSNHERVANMQANDDEENANQVMRSIGGAMAMVETALADYLTEPGTTTNALADPAEDVTLRLRVPPNFNHGALRGLTEGVHGYLVATAVADWFDITDREDADTYRRNAERWMAQVKESICKRLRPTRATTERRVPQIG